MMSNSESRKRESERENRRPPSIGRIVHYRSRGSADRRFDPMCRAAMIVDVNPRVSTLNDIADLSVFNPTGLFFDQNVPRSVDLIPGTWHWYDECEETS